MNLEWRSRRLEAIERSVREHAEQMKALSEVIRDMRERSATEERITLKEPPYPALEEPIAKLAALVPAQLEPDELDTYGAVIERAADRIKELESQRDLARAEARRSRDNLLSDAADHAVPRAAVYEAAAREFDQQIVSEDELAAARDITRDYDEVRYRLVHLAGREEPGGDPIREFVTEIESRVELLESQLAAAREEQGLEARVATALGPRYQALQLTRLAMSGIWQACWCAPAWSRRNERKAQAPTLPALLRAILDVEKGGGG